MTTFEQFGLAAPINRALVEEKYVTPTPIQAGAIPLVLEGRDIIGLAQTGTGKTAAFALPILDRLGKAQARPERKSCRVLVLSPTRELSNQIVDSFRTYGRHMRVSTAIAIGGVPIGKQIRSLANGVDVLVATPGRLLDLVGSRSVALDRVEVLVLDEADRMLDMGFIHDIRKIVGMLPRKRQTLFFSATMPKEIAGLADQMLTNPARVAVAAPAATADRIDQRVIHTDRGAKNSLLVDLLKKDPDGRTIVFTRTKHGADRVVKALNVAGLDAAAIHGNKSQGQREKALASFRDGRVPTLVATDIAARGIDVVGISHVVNFDLPNIPESYIHRIGRTARAGAAGIATSFCSHDEAPFLRSIEQLIRMSIPATGAPVRSAPAAKADAEWDPVKRADGENGRRQRGRGNGRGRGQGQNQNQNQNQGNPQRNGKGQGQQPQKRGRRPRPGPSADGGFARLVAGIGERQGDGALPIRFGE